MSEAPVPILEPFETLQAQGATPTELYTEAKRRGIARLDAIRLLRQLYSLPFDEARTISWEVDGYPSNRLRPIKDHADLLATLKQELGYCGCAYSEAAIRVLRETLELCKARRDSFGHDPGETWSRVAETLGTTLSLDTAPGLATWFLYFLDHRDFVEHAENVQNCWITDKGVTLLEGLQAHGEPPEEDQTDGLE